MENSLYKLTKLAHGIKILEIFMAQQVSTNNINTLKTTDGELIKRAKSAAKSDLVPVFVTHNPEERREAFHNLRNLTCKEITDPTAKLVLCQGSEPTAEELDKLAISSLRFGKGVEQCGVTLDRETLDTFVTKYVDSDESKEELAKFVSYHEGAHCQDENTRGQKLVLQDMIDMEPAKLRALTTYREAHADAYAILALSRELAYSGKFDKLRKFLGEASAGFRKPEAKELDNPITRRVIFEAFAQKKEELNDSKLARLTDEELNLLATRFARTGVAALNGTDSQKKAQAIIDLLQQSLVQNNATEEADDTSWRYL